MIGAELFADRQPVVARAGQHDRRSAERLGDRDREQADRPRPGDDHALAGDQPAELGQAVHRRAGGDDERRLLVATCESGTRTSVLMLLMAYSAKPPSVVKPLARWPLSTSP